ncbi:MAG: DNA polymerase III subunit gamma/tau [Bacteroidaceae bacterium]
MEKSHYIVSARKYRPDTFSSVVGQQSLVTTLKNAILRDKLAHAYLFCGPRGVGKTTCARIFAKTINCEHLTSDGEACNTCESCVSFNEQRSLNIYEMDAASNNSVNDIKQLIDQVRVLPQVGQYKVYIIDEVHMLSASAFNAFLKTLEEPPAHAVFILATTEKHKLLPTILSRCQIYDFSRITVEDIVEHLAHVADKEGIKAETEALHVIALKADGGMRDALSIFDQVVSYCSGDVTYDKTIANLHVLGYDYYFNLVRFLLAGEIPSGLLLFDEVLNNGFDARQFINGLASHLRNLMVGASKSTLGLLEVGASIRQKYLEQASAVSLPFIYQALDICNQCDLHYRESNNKRLLVELALIQIGQILHPIDRSGGHALGAISKPFASGGTKAEQRKSVATVQPTKGASMNVAGTSITVDKAVTSPVVSSTTSMSEKGTTVPIAISKDTSSEPAISQTVASDVSTNYEPSGRRLQSISIRRKRAKNGVIAASVTQNGSAGVLSGNQGKEISQNKAPFDDEKLRSAWFAFIQILPKEYNALAGRLQNAPIYIKEENQVEFLLGNDIVADNVKPLLSQITLFLRKELKNDFIELNYSISVDAMPVINISGAELYKKMNKDNPVLGRLKKKFFLDLN